MKQWLLKSKLLLSQKRKRFKSFLNKKKQCSFSNVIILKNITAFNEYGINKCRFNKKIQDFKKHIQDVNMDAVLAEILNDIYSSLTKQSQNTLRNC